MQKLRNWLYIGNYKDLQSISETSFDDIDVVLNLVEDLPISSKEVLFLDIDDGVPLRDLDIVKGSEFLLNSYYQEKTILVACGAGVSRSVTFCTLILKEVEQLSLIDTLKNIKAIYPKALPHPALWKSICDAYGESFDYYEVIQL